MLQQFERKIHGQFHHFAAIQGTEYNEFFTLWKGVCTNIFSFSDYVCRSEYVSRKNNLDNALSSDDEIQGASPLLSCRYYTLAHDHRVKTSSSSYSRSSLVISLK